MIPEKPAPPFPLLAETLQRAAEEYPLQLSACLSTLTRALVTGMDPFALAARVADALQLHPERGGGTNPQSARTAIAIIAAEYGTRPLNLGGVLGALRQAALLALTVAPGISDLLPPGEHARLAAGHLIQYVKKTHVLTQEGAEILVWERAQYAWRRLFVPPALAPIVRQPPPEWRKALSTAPTPAPTPAPAPTAPPPAEEPPAAPAASLGQQEPPMAVLDSYLSDAPATATPDSSTPKRTPRGRPRTKRSGEMCGVEGCSSPRGRQTTIGDPDGVYLPACSPCRSRWYSRVRRGQASLSPASLDDLQHQASLNRMTPADQRALVSDRPQRPCLRADCSFPGMWAVAGHPGAHVCDSCRCRLYTRLSKGLCALPEGFTLEELQTAVGPLPAHSREEAKRLAKKARSAGAVRSVPLSRALIPLPVEKAMPAPAPAPAPDPAPAPVPALNPHNAALLRIGDEVRITHPHFIRYLFGPLGAPQRGSLSDVERLEVVGQVHPALLTDILVPMNGWPQGLVKEGGSVEVQEGIRTYRAFLMAITSTHSCVLRVSAEQNKEVFPPSLRPSQDIFLWTHLGAVERVVHAPPAPAPCPPQRPAQPAVILMSREDIQRRADYLKTADQLKEVLDSTRGLAGPHGASGSLCIARFGQGVGQPVPLYPAIRDALEQAVKALLISAFTVYGPDEEGA